MHITNPDLTDKQQKDSLLNLMADKMIANTSGIDVKQRT